MNVDELAELLVNGHRTHVLSGLLGLSDRERKDLGPKTRRWLTHGNMAKTTPRQALAVLATAGGARQAMLVANHLYNWDQEFIDDAVTLLQQRAPSWLPDLVQHLLDDEGVFNWRLVRRLVRAGVVAAPEHPEYYRRTVFAVNNRLSRVPLVEVLQDDPELIGEHLISMLATEGTGRLLAYHDSYHETDHKPLPNQPLPYQPRPPFPDGTWRRALASLALDGCLDRGRLLDVVLAAPLRDWAAADLGWYVGMHDALKPTLEEIAERQATYARLLTVEHGPSVKTAQRELLRLMPDPRFETEPFLDASRATLQRTDKASVTAHLRLLEKLANAHPRVPIANTVRTATDHVRADVRDRAAKLLARLGEDATPAAEEPPFVVPHPHLRRSAPAVQPVRSADDLAEVLLGLLEEVDPVEMERAIDGLLRLADERPTTADLLWTRASASQYYVDDPRIAPAILTLAWLTPRKRLRDGDWPILLGHSSFPAAAAAPQTFVGALGRRLTGVAHAIRRGRHTSVALPTSSDGILAADELSRRLSDVGRPHPAIELELAIALLRVPHEQRASVAIPRSLWKSAAVARVLETPSPDWERVVASYQRDYWEPEHRIPVFRDKRGHERNAAAGILARATPERTLDAEVAYGEYDPRFEQTLAFGASLLPHDHDVLAAHAHPYLHRDLRKDRACCVPVLDALAQARSANGEPASSALVLGLAAKDARGRTAAQDAILDLARHGVLDGDSLGRQAALLLQDDIVVGQRLNRGLAECARASDAAVVPVLEALQQILTVLPGRRDAGAFVELAADLAERTGRKVALPSEFRQLASGKSSSMLAKASRRLL